MVPVIYVVFEIDSFMRDQFTFLAKVNIRVKMFSVCSLHLMENSMFVKMLINTDIFYQHLSATINRVLV